MGLLRLIDHDSRANATPFELDNDGELLTTVLSVVFIDSLYSDKATGSG